MEQRIDINKRVEDTMNSLDGIQRATPKPYFYTRLRAKMNNEANNWSGIAGLIRRPAYAFTMIAVVVSLNAWLIFKNNNSTTAANTTNFQVNTSDVPEEYNMAVTTLYNYETP